MEKMTLKTQRINKNIDKCEINPLTGGLILRSTWRGRIAGHSTRPIKAGAAVHIPDGYYGVITNATALIKNYPCLLRPQTITTEDREELELLIVNYSPYPEPISLNQVMAELILYPIQDVNMKTVAKLSSIKASKE